MSLGPWRSTVDTTRVVPWYLCLLWTARSADIAGAAAQPQRVAGAQAAAPGAARALGTGVAARPRRRRVETGGDEPPRSRPQFGRNEPVLPAVAVLVLPAQVGERDLADTEGEQLMHLRGEHRLNQQRFDIIVGQDDTGAVPDLRHGGAWRVRPAQCVVDDDCLRFRVFGGDQPGDQHKRGAVYPVACVAQTGPGRGQLGIGGEIRGGPGDSQQRCPDGGIGGHRLVSSTSGDGRGSGTSLTAGTVRTMPPSSARMSRAARSNGSGSPAAAGAIVGTGTWFPLVCAGGTRPPQHTRPRRPHRNRPWSAGEPRSRASGAPGPGAGVCLARRRFARTPRGTTSVADGLCSARPADRPHAHLLSGFAQELSGYRSGMWRGLSRPALMPSRMVVVSSVQLNSATPRWRRPASVR